MSDLTAKQCVPCQGGVAPLSGEQIKPLLDQLDDWNLVDEHHLTKTYALPDFKAALALTNRIGELAEGEGHHPDIHLAWGKVGVTTWTHKIDGLTESDFILAAKIDALPRE